MAKLIKKLVCISFAIPIVVFFYNVATTKTKSVFTPDIAVEIISEISHSAPSTSISNIPPAYDNSQGVNSLSENTSHVNDIANNEVEKPTTTPPIDRKMINEMSVIVVNEEGVPVPNIGVYANPKAGFPLHKSADYAVSAQDGIAVLQRIRKTFAWGESIEIGLCDRNQSNQAMQLSSEVIPDEITDMVTLVWHGEMPATYEAEATNRLTIQLLTTDRLPVADAWISISNNREEKPDGNMENTEIIPEGIDLYMLDRDRGTDKEGKVVFTNLSEGEYSITVYVGKPPFSNVASEHPRLQQKFKMQRYTVQHVPEGSVTEKLIFTEKSD